MVVGPSRSLFKSLKLRNRIHCKLLENRQEQGTIPKRPMLSNPLMSAQILSKNPGLAPRIVAENLRGYNERIQKDLGTSEIQGSNRDRFSTTMRTLKMRKLTMTTLKTTSLKQTTLKMTCRDLPLGPGWALGPLSGPSLESE